MLRYFMLILELDSSVPVPRQVEGAIRSEARQQGLIVVKNLLGVTLSLEVAEQ